MSFNNRIKQAITSVTGFLQKNAPPPVPGPPRPGPDPIPAEVLMVWQCSQKNRRLVIAYRPGTDPNNPMNLLSVNVAANHNFIPRMKLRALPVPDQRNVFNLVGPLPRWRGRM